MADIRVLDPTHPDLISLAIEMEAARRTPTRTTRRGPLAMAALVFVATLLGARWLNDFSTTAPTSSGEVSRSVATPTVPATGPAPPAALVPAVEPPAASIALPSPPAPDMFRSVVEGERPGSDRPTTAASAAPAPTVDASPDQDATPVGTVDRDTRASDDAPAEAEVRMPARPPIQGPPQDGPVTLSAPQVAPAVPPAPAALPTPVEPQHAAAPAASGASGVLLASATRPVAAADEELVQRVLQHYRLAYEALDAGSARTVWPTVNQGALQRAFDGLESQQLTFADCNVQVRDGAGAATCRGTARYVPKVGSRDMHVEPRTWRFTLRKSGEAWQIETARAER